MSKGALLWEMRRLTGTWRYEVVCVRLRDCTLPEVMKRVLVVRSDAARHDALVLMRRLNGQKHE